MATIIGDEFGGSVYTPPKPKAPGLANVFNAGRSLRSGRERDVATGGGETGPRGGNLPTFVRKTAPPPPVVETVIGDLFGGAPLVPPKPKGMAAWNALRARGGVVSPGGSQSVADPDRRQAEREFGGFGGLFG